MKLKNIPVREIINLITKLSLCIIIIFTLSSCDEKAEGMSSDINGIKDLLNIPFTPSSAKWKFSKHNNHWIQLGPVDYDVVAVLTFEPADFQVLKKELSNKAVDKHQLKLEFVESWFPDSVKNRFVNQGDHLYVETYDAEMFGKNPLLTGFCFLTNNNELFIYMFTN